MVGTVVVATAAVVVSTAAAVVSMAVAVVSAAAAIMVVSEGMAAMAWAATALGSMAAATTTRLTPTTIAATQATPVYPSSTYYVPDYSLYTQPLMTNTNTSLGMAGTLPVATEYSARINVKVPDGATVWFDGKKTVQGGTERNFVTPPLDTGKTFSYDLQAAWPQGNRLITQTRKIEFTAGGHTDVDFTKPASGEVSTAPY